ncbi:MAG: Rieske (2Fe-2S) protein [Acidobacteriota bacterium]
MAETTTETRKWIEVGAAEEIKEGQARTFEADGERVAIARANGQLYAVQDLCSHDDGPLGEGSIEGYAIICPRHGAKFDIRTGGVLAMPAIASIETYPVMEKDGKVMLAVRRAQGTADEAEDDTW